MFSVESTSGNLVKWSIHMRLYRLPSQWSNNVYLDVFETSCWQLEVSSNLGRLALDASPDPFPADGVNSCPHNTLFCHVCSCSDFRVCESIEGVISFSKEALGYLQL